MTDENLHRSTYRVLRIFDLLSNTPDGMSLTQLADALDVPKGSLHPILKTMLQMNYIQSDVHNVYKIGQAAYFAGSSYTWNNDLLQEIDYIIKRIAQQVQQNVFLAILFEGSVLYLIQERISTPIEIRLRPGYRFPAYTTGIGKALLSGYSKEELQEIYPDGLHAMTPYTITDFDALEEQLIEIRQSGFSFDKEESSVGLQCIAVPITYQGNVIAAVSCVTSVSTYTREYENNVMEVLDRARKDIQKMILLNPQEWTYSPLS